MHGLAARRMGDRKLYNREWLIGNLGFRRPMSKQITQPIKTMNHTRVTNAQFRTLLETEPRFQRRQ
jgi:hypothetical protein